MPNQDFISHVPAEAHEALAPVLPSRLDTDYPGLGLVALEPAEPVGLDINNLRSPEVTFDPESGVTQGLVAVVKANDTLFGISWVVKDRTSEEEDLNGCYLQISRLVNPDEANGEVTPRAKFVGLVAQGEKVVYGREQLDPHNLLLSKRHFFVGLGSDGRVVIGDDGSTNGTHLGVFEEPPRQPRLRKLVSRSPKVPKDALSVSDYISDKRGWSTDPEQLKRAIVQKSSMAWDYTQYSREKLKAMRGVVNPEVYGDRPVITRNSAINGGVSVVPGLQEAIVVDDSPNRDTGGLYDQAFSRFISKIAETAVENTIDSRQIGVAKAALETVKDIISYDLKYSEEIRAKYKDEKIDLAYLMADGRGVCRHQALLAAYLVERLINSGQLEGNVSYNRNEIPGESGHAWARYESSDGEVYIIDPAQDFAGSLEEAMKAGLWDYRRPEDDPKLLRSVPAT